MSDKNQRDDEPRTSDELLLAQRLRDAREYIGLSQEQVAAYLGIPRASVSAMENGKRKVSTTELKKLSRLYKHPIPYLLGEVETAGAVDLEDETAVALFRATQALSEADREQVLRFAQFLREAGQAPRTAGGGIK